jgi:DNA-binding protein HU-beta
MAANKAAAKPLNQTQVVAALAEATGKSKADVKSFLNTLGDLAAKQVKKNGAFQLPGFGKLVMAKRAARKGRNPMTGAEIKIPAKTTVKFRVAKAMKDSIVPPKK